jgi:hypothetical protein
MSNGSAWLPSPVEPATVGEPTGASDARRDGVHVDLETERLIENLRQRHVRLLMALRPGLCQPPHAPRSPAAVRVADPPETARQTEAAFDDVVRAAAAASLEAIAPGPVSDVTSRPTDMNRGPPLLVDYKEAAYLLSLCKPKVGDTSLAQAEKRGVNALKQRVASGRIPARCIKRSGRRVQFVRVALVEWVSGRSKVQA